MIVAQKALLLTTQNVSAQNNTLKFCFKMWYIFLMRYILEESYYQSVKKNMTKQNFLVVILKQTLYCMNVNLICARKILHKMRELRVECRVLLFFKTTKKIKKNESVILKIERNEPRGSQRYKGRRPSKRL